MSPRKPRAVQGRPTKLDQVLRVENGAEITVADEILERIAIGATISDAAASVGIDRETLHRWIREGARAASRRAQGHRLTRAEARLADFSNAEAQAVAAWKVTQETQLEILSGGRTRKVVTEKRDSAGNLLEKTERTEGIDPDARVIMWRLERRFRDQYGRQALEISGPGGGPIPLSVREEAAQAIEAAAQRLSESLEALGGLGSAPPSEGP